MKSTSLCFALSSALVAGCAANNASDVEVVSEAGSNATDAPDTVQRFRVTQLVTNETDPDLVNPWGIVGGEGVFWIADEATGKVSVYDGNGQRSREYPTGRFNLGEGITGVARLESDEEDGEEEEADAFLIPVASRESSDCDSGETEPAEFVFASEEGKLIAINDESSTSGVTVVDRSADGDIYLGVAKLDMADGPVLLAADFGNAHVDMFDAKFHHIDAGDRFVDPEMPAGFGPFNVMVADDLVYVMYAKIGEPGEEEAGPGLGAVTVFDATGNVVGRLTSDLFNAPWGMTIAESESEMCDEDSPRTIFIGNFGDGHITQFNADTLEEIGQVSDRDGTPIALDGLWGIAMGSDEAGDEDALYFVQGPEDETEGVFGRIDPID